MKRARLKLFSKVLRPTTSKRPKEYLDLRYWWLHELSRLRAAKRVNAIDTSKDIRIVQKELVRLRRDY